MRSRSAVLAGSTLAAAVALFTLTPAATASGPTTRSGPAGRTMRARAGTTSSLNWAGYSVAPPAGNVVAVHAAFRVPSVADVTPGFAATWTGIGGIATTDLIQAGVGEQFAPGLGPSYYAWYEILPAAETPIANCAGDRACTVAPGDRITVDIHEVGSGLWSVGLADAGRWTYAATIPYRSSHSSAEWIQEAPSVLSLQTVLPVMGSAVFDGANSFRTAGGPSRSIAAGAPDSIVLATIEGQPSRLDADGDGFAVCAYALSCSPPAS